MTIKPSTPQKRIQAWFYASDSGNEPVKEALLELGRPTKTVVGEVRHTVEDIEYRTLFFVFGSDMILVHFFKKTSKKTPKSDLDLGWGRMKKWMHSQRDIENKIKKAKR